jgi:hypothetical protein
MVGFDGMLLVRKFYLTTTLVNIGIKMNKNLMSTLNIPPPPPPSSSKSSSKKLIAALVIVIAVVAAVGAYYVMTLPHDNNPGPSPSATPSISATSTASSSPATSPSTSPYASTSPTSTPQTSAGFRDGAWANYTTANYDANGAVTANYDLSYAIDQGTLKGVDCWLLQTELKLSIDGDVSKTSMTYWLDKSTLQGLHYKIETSANGTVIYSTENDYAPGDVNDIPTAIDPNMVLSQESITVPAGQFNCYKAATTMTDLGKTYVTTVWGNSDIPVVGMVKQQMTQDGVLISSTELLAYGG